jgi:hypothetical protein
MNTICLICKKEVKGKWFCSKECRSSELGRKIIYERKQAKWRITLGTDNPQKLKSVREKTKQKNLDTCGHTCNLHSEDGIKKKQATWEAKYGEGITNPMQAESAKKKAQNKCEENTGYRNPQQCPSIRKKTENKCIEIYGYKSPLGSPIIQQKITETNNKVHHGPRPACDPTVKEKMKKTCEKKYNGSSPSASPEVKNKAKVHWNGENSPFCLPEIKEKIVKKNIDNLGVPNPFMSQTIQNQIKAHNLKTLGHENPFGSSIIQEKINQFWKNNPDKFEAKITKMTRTKFDIYYKQYLIDMKIVKPLFDINEYKGSNFAYKWLCLGCNLEFTDYIIPRCLNCFPITTGTSFAEQKLQKWLESYIEIKRNKRYFEGFRKYKYELDVLVPSKNIGIEYDGLYYHSEIRGCKYPYYHLNKSDYFFKNKNIFVIHIFESEWLHKQEIVKSLISRELNLIENKIDSVDCVLKKISSEESNKFLEKNHIQGSCKSNKQLGLFYNQELISVLVLKDNEILRYGDKLNLEVIGSFEKFLKEILGSVIIKIDRRFESGNFYLKNNFELIDMLSPKSFYTNYNFFSSKILDFKMKSYNPLNSDLENILNNKLDRIWDCGQLILSRK